MRGVHRFQDLVAWQLADRLRKLAISYCEKPELRRDFKYEKGYLSAEEFDRGDHAARRALKVLNRFIAYLESTPDWGKD
jgi:hypothetical protein